MERPIAVYGEKAVIARPLEKIKRLYYFFLDTFNKPL